MFTTNEYSLPLADDQHSLFILGVLFRCSRICCAGTFSYAETEIPPTRYHASIILRNLLNLNRDTYRDKRKRINWSCLTLRYKFNNSYLDNFCRVYFACGRKRLILSIRVNINLRSMILDNESIYYSRSMQYIFALINRFMLLKSNLFVK